jgi:hypothetical protein
MRTVSIRLFAPCPRPDSGLTPTSSAEVALGDCDRKTDLDVGDVQLERRPLLVAGRVVDSEGHGLPHPRIEVWEGAARDGGFPGFQFNADRNGGFTIHADTVTGSLSVAAELDGWHAADTRVGASQALILPKVHVAAGTADVSIVLHRDGQARGEFLLDPSVDPSAIRLECAPPALAATVVREEGTRFRLVGIPGLCDLSVLGSGSCLLTLIDRIELREGAWTRDSRIQPLDLTGVVRMPVTVVDPLGAPIAGATLSLSTSSNGNRSPRPFRTDPFGHEVIVAVHNDGPLLVVAPDLRLQRVVLESTEKRIALASGIHVACSLQGVSEVSSDLLASLSARFIPDRSDTSPTVAMIEGLDTHSRPQVPGDAVIDLFVSAPGRYSLHGTLTGPDRRPESESHFVPDPSEIGVADTNEVQNVSLRIRDVDFLRRMYERQRR